MEDGEGDLAILRLFRFESLMPPRLARLQVAEGSFFELAPRDQGLAQREHEGPRLAARVARGGPGAEPVRDALEERGVGAAGVRELLARHPRLLRQQLGLAQLALDFAFQAQPVPVNRRADELVRVEMLRNQFGCSLSARDSPRVMGVPRVDHARGEQLGENMCGGEKILMPKSGRRAALWGLPNTAGRSRVR